MVSLTKAIPGKHYIISWMLGYPDAIQIIHECQIEEGSDIRVIQKCRSGLIIGSEKKRVVISNDMAERIKVSTP